MSVSSDLNKAFDKKVRQAISNGIKSAAIELNGDLAFETPVKTGAAQWNWIPSIGTPSGDIVTTKGDSEQLAQQGTQERASQLLSDYDVLTDGDIWISNNLPYIAPLNNGTSQQADAGFVDALVSNIGIKIKALVKAGQNERT